MLRIKSFIKLCILALLLLSTGCEKCNDDVSRHLRYEDQKRTEFIRKRLIKKGVIEPQKGKEVEDV